MRASTLAEEVQNDTVVGAAAEEEALSPLWLVWKKENDNLVTNLKFMRVRVNIRVRNIF